VRVVGPRSSSTLSGFRPPDHAPPDSAPEAPPTRASRAPTSAGGGSCRRRRGLPAGRARARRVDQGRVLRAVDEAVRSRSCRYGQLDVSSASSRRRPAPRSRRARRRRSRRTRSREPEHGVVLRRGHRVAVGAGRCPR
jgi:hypothetical protein